MSNLMIIGRVSLVVISQVRFLHKCGSHLKKKGRVLAGLPRVLDSRVKQGVDRIEARIRDCTPSQCSKSPYFGALSG